MQSTHGCQRLVQKKLEAVQSSVQEQQRRAQGLQAQIDRFAARQREEHNANAAKFRQVRVRPWALHQRPAASAQCAHPSLHCSTLCLADRAAGSLCSCVRMKTICTNQQYLSALLPLLPEDQLQHGPLPVCLPLREAIMPWFRVWG